jgi:hypothetical protein
VKKDSPVQVEPPLAPLIVARLLNIHTNTVRRWSSSGILKPYPGRPAR